MSRRKVVLAFLACSIPMFMAALNNLVVLTALESIRTDLDAGLSDLQWFSNAYILAFAGLLLVVAGLGDRFGRRRVFVTGIAVFALGSLLCGLSPDSGSLIAARTVQGVGAAMVTPLSLTLLVDAVPANRRGLMIGLWSAFNGAAISLGPVVGGAVLVWLDWRWVFWVNVPVAVIAAALAMTRLQSGRRHSEPIDIPGMLWSAGAVAAAIWTIVHAPDYGWTSAQTLTGVVVTAVLGVGLVLRERGTESPLVPPRLLRNRAFSLTNAVALCMHLGVFGSIFLLASFLQVGYGFDPLQAGVRTLAWTVMPMLMAPMAGALTERLGGGRLMALGLALQAIGLGWIALAASPPGPYAALVLPMVIAGTGMGLVFAPMTATVVGAVPEDDRGTASGVNMTVREVGGALGIAVLGSVFAAYGGYAGPEQFAAGVERALYVGVVVCIIGALAALAIPRGPTASTAVSGQPTGTERTDADPREIIAPQSRPNRSTNDSLTRP